MRRFVALLTLKDHDALVREQGYAPTRDAYDRLAAAIPSILPSAHDVRANRATVELFFEAHSAADAHATLSGLCAELDERAGYALRAAAAALPDDARDFSEFAGVERLLAKALQSDHSVLVADDTPPGLSDARLLEELSAAMEDGSLSLHYQAKLRSRSGEIAGAEALLRWTHPSHGALSPAMFIPIVETTPLMRPLTHWVIDRALADGAALRAIGLKLPVHVNIPAPLVADPAFRHAALDQIGQRALDIGFEITESAMIADPEGALANLQAFADAGIRLAIDDYGTGYSSLAYLQRLPVHELKIDQRFISTLSTSARDPLLVRSTIDLAHALEMEVTAEGVECAAAAALLQVMRCDLLQGYFLSRPLPLDGFIAFARAAAAGATPKAEVRSLRQRLAERRAEQRPTV